jgi:hypothetical protein
LSDHSSYTNGTDTFYTTKMSDGGIFVLYRYGPSLSSIMTNPYPEIVIRGGSIRYVTSIPTSPFYEERTVRPPVSLTTPYSQLKWPALLSDDGMGIFLVAESPIFEEAIEPFVSGYPSLRVNRERPTSLRLSFDQVGAQPKAVALKWVPVEHTATTTTYTALISDPLARAIEVHLPDPGSAKRVWYLTGKSWTAASTQAGGPHDPDLLLLETDKPNMILVESQTGPPQSQATLYSTLPGYVERARWAAFSLYDGQTGRAFFARSMTTSLKAYNDRLSTLRDQTPAHRFPNTWRRLLELVGFTKGENLLNPKFFSVGFPEAADPSYEVDDRLKMSVSWVSDEAALQAVMGARLFGFSIDPRYAVGVDAFYDPRSVFYYGAYKRDTRKFTSADTGGDGVVIGYNYLLSLARLTELIGTPLGLAAKQVQALVDRVLPILQRGYVDEFSQVPYLWSYPELKGIQWEYGMGKELSEAQLSYVCGLWWLRTHETRYSECELRALGVPEELALTLRGSSYLWGLDVVHGAYVTDALLLAYRTTGARHYLEAALNGWREELLFLFSDLNYPETSFDDRGMAVTSYYSTFADLHRGNYWRGDAWNNSRTVWSLAKLLAFVDDPRIVWQVEIARETHKQSMPQADAVYNPVQRSLYYGKLIDTADFELNWEDLRSHYSTQIGFSNDVWREAFIFESIQSPDARVYRIPGVLLTDPGLAYVVGKPGSVAQLTIEAKDCTFASGLATIEVRLDSAGVARVPLFSSGA